MAFGINREQLERWKEQVVKGEIAVITHYWEDERFPGCTSVTKVGCSNLEKLKEWGETYKLKSTWIDRKSTRLNSSHVSISYAVFCLKKKSCTCSEKRWWKYRTNSVLRRNYGNVGGVWIIRLDVLRFS